MSEPRGAALPALGARIRSERLRRGISVRGLARDIGVSASLVSQIETGKNQPSVSTLYAITSVLGVGVEDLFDADHAAGPDAEDDATPTGRGGARDGTGAPGRADARGPIAAVEPARGGNGPAHVHHPPRGGPVVDPSAREVLTLDSGVTWERLGQLPDAHIDFLLITYAPGGSSSSSGELMRHRGTEFGHLVSGELVLTLGDGDQRRDHRLVAGDSVCFDSSTPHRLRNDGATPAVGVWFVLERG